MTTRLLVLDLDGTVLGHDLVISSAVRDAIRKAQASGVTVTIATGRHYSSAAEYAHDLNINAPIICYQGAVIRDPVTGETLSETLLPGSLAAEAVELLQEEDITPVAFRDGRTYTTGPSAGLDLFLSYHPGGEAYVTYESDLVTFARDTPPVKILFSVAPDALDERIARLAKHFKTSLAVVRSHMYFGEITAPGVTKGSALMILAEHLGIRSSDVMAVGDQENDLPMLAWAGFGIAMANAPESVRAVADAIVPPIAEDGAAVAIETYLLNPK